MEISELYNLDP